MILDISRKEATGNSSGRQQGEIIDNLWIIIDFIFDFYAYLYCQKLVDNLTRKNLILIILAILKSKIMFIKNVKSFVTMQRQIFDIV
ncbi:MAG: hypothetical protein F6K24_16120 [Okeania sp. SIO2D1]|nr:hypothetical protein [Okeania sp. SIO2D1]